MLSPPQAGMTERRARFEGLYAAIHAPILGNFGGQDRGITPDDVHAFEKAVKAAGKPINVKIYPDAGHAFENPNNKVGYRAADAADAWTRMVDFFNKTLK